jgi:hypothetical protein
MEPSGSTPEAAAAAACPRDARPWLALAFLLAIAGTLICMSQIGAFHTWLKWSMGPMPETFADLRVITAGAESWREGHDPLYHNPNDPWQRQMNYPRVWQVLGPLGIDQRATNLLGVALLLTFLSSLFVWSGPLSFGAATMLFLGTLAPATVMAIERGNIDLLMFVLCAFALRWIGRPWLSGGLIFVATALKLFPVLAFVSLGLRNHRRLWVLALVFGALTALYLIITYADLAQIRFTTPRSHVHSYGVMVAERLALAQGILPGPEVHHWLIRGLWFTSAALLVLPFVVDRYAAPQLSTGRYIDGFRLGAVIYLGTFLLGTNWDYRLMFLLFCLPQLWEWSREGDGWGNTVATTALVLALASLWSFKFEGWEREFFETHRWLWWDEIANWGVFGTLSLLLIVSAPGPISRWRRALPPTGETSPPPNRS